MNFNKIGDSMKNKNFFQSVLCAFRGIKSGFSSEHNFKIYVAIASVFLVLNIVVSAGIYDYIILLILTCFTFSAEYINTAIERICDCFCDESNRDVGFIKDVGAAAVLVSGFAFFIGEGIVLISKLL